MNKNREAANALAADLLQNRPEVPNPAGLMHRVEMDYQIRLGQPSFPHVFHVIMTIITGGGWLLVYVPCWLMSAQRRYLKARRRALQAHGLL
jgi:hypothetical protein